MFTLIVALMSFLADEPARVIEAASPNTSLVPLTEKEVITKIIGHKISTEGLCSAGPCPSYAIYASGTVIGGSPQWQFRYHVRGNYIVYEGQTTDTGLLLYRNREGKLFAAEVYDKSLSVPWSVHVENLK